MSAWNGHGFDIPKPRRMMAMSTDLVPDENSEPEGEPVPERKWQPLSSVQQRVIGVLVEKAKTTPEQYPLSLNSLTTGCNQKSNRYPHMNLDPDDVEQALEELRHVGAVVEIQSGGRVAKYKHCMYEWLGVDKVELAVIAELLLRGAQTVGELRGRAARMEPIADLHALRPVLGSLVEKELVIELTPEGRGQHVTHGLYGPAELEEMRSQYQGHVDTRPASRPTSRTSGGGSQEVVQQLQADVAELRAEVERLRELVERMTGM
jgi:uncharacterized protein YceH (UPF0502 family)